MRIDQKAGVRQDRRHQVAQTGEKRPGDFSQLVTLYDGKLVDQPDRQDQKYGRKYAVQQNPVQPFGETDLVRRVPLHRRCASGFGRFMAEAECGIGKRLPGALRVFRR